VIGGSRRIPSLGLTQYEHWKIPELREKVYAILEQAIVESQFEFDTVISGACWGIDQLGEEWAKKNSKELISKPADWDRYGKGAGFFRNGEMAKEGDMLICVCTKDSRGSWSMMKLMNSLHKPVYVKYVQ